MKPHYNAELFETQISTLWFDEHGILCGLSKKTERTIEQYQELMELYKELTKDGKKLCLLADSSNSTTMSDEVIKFISTEQQKYIKAIAVLSDAPLGSPQVSTFLKLTFSDFPVMKFSCENEAREWLKGYL